MLRDNVRKGDTVRWAAYDTELIGKVVKILTHDLHIEVDHGGERGIDTHKVMTFQCEMVERGKGRVIKLPRDTRKGPQMWKAPRRSAPWTQKPYQPGDWLGYTDGDGNARVGQVAHLHNRDGFLAVTALTPGPNEIATFTTRKTKEGEIYAYTEHGALRHLDIQTYEPFEQLTLWDGEIRAVAA